MPPCQGPIPADAIILTSSYDPFHLVRLANQKLDECRRRVQNQTLGHRGRKIDPLYRARRLLTRADERLDDNGRSRLLGLLLPVTVVEDGGVVMAEDGGRRNDLRP